ncbi:Hypothetical predicted protein [Mytilus galloprovincialis]|uniref:Death domain-containing protein n=1 Tax=Mytilus galloprovincialis TaxID=29158 RepID=A0A8B6H799_MYTGA|nr:Hypothetical predicted protein [Mytilus galloprovincialis]
MTALHLASSNGHKEVVTILLDHDAELNAKNTNGSTALHWATCNITSQGMTALHLASSHGHKEVVTILLEHDADTNVKETKGWLPLHCAASRGYIDIVSELFRRETDVNAETSKGETALHLSSNNGHKEVVTILLDHAAHPNAKTADGWLPLHCAASAGYRDIVSELLRRGTDANAETSKGETALHLSSRNGHKEVVTILLDHASHPNAKTADGITALHLASSNGHMEVVTILLDYSADPNIKSADVSRKGWLALHFADYNGHSDIVSELIRRGTDVDSVTTKEEKEKYELLHQLRGFGLGTASDLQELLRESSFQSFWNRVYLVGPNSVGKSCLAKILVGEQVPQSRKSTDGIWIYMGRAGMDVDEMKWIYFEKGNAVTEILTNMLMTVSSAEAATEARDNSTNFHKKQKLLEPTQKCEYLEMKDGNDLKKGSLVGAKAIKYNASSHHETKRAMADSSTIVHPKQATARKFRNQEMQIDDVRQSGLLEGFSTPYALSHQDSKRKTADTIVDLKSYEGNSFDIQRSEGYINPNSSQEGIQGEHSKYNEHKVADDQCSISNKIKTSSVFDSSVKQLIRELSIGKTQTNQRILEQLDSEWMKEISSDMSIDKLHELMVKAVKEGKYKQMVVPIDIWDFGGQKEYHMTHQLFITSRGIFILMFDGSIDIHKHRSDLGFLPGHFGKPTAAVYLLHWVNSILTFCKRSKEGFPKILFVATHKDMLPLMWKYRFESYRQKLENKIQKIFESHAGLKHLEFKPLLFINSTNPEDPEIKELQQRVMKRATEHPRWGEEMPTAWIPLDLQLTMKVEEGTNILSLEQIKSLNSKKKSMALSEKQIVTFLEVQHSLGKLLYFNVENLRDYVIISPAYLVEVLRSIVTEKQFWCKSGRFPSILKNIQETGFIDKEDIYHLWTQKEFMHFLKYKEYMVDLLVHLDVIIAPRTSFELSSSPLRDVSRFLVPCMITKTNDTKYLEKFWNYNNSIVMAYRFIEEIIPPALSYRFLGSLVAMWHVKKYACTKNKREKTLLFSDLYVVEVGNSHELAVQVKGNRVVVSLVHTVNKGNIIPTLASSIQECLTTAMLGICQFYSTLSDAQNSSSKHQAMPFEIEFGVFCKSDICFFHHNDIRPNSPWFCSQHRKKNEVGYLQAWFSEKEPSDKCLSTCIGLGRMALERSPSDKHLRRLVGEFSPGKCRELAIELGLSVHEWENFEYQFQFQIPDDLKFVAIRSCREKSRNFTFRMLVRVLEKLELSQHLLCKVLRDVKPDVSGIPEDTLNNPPSDKLLFDLSNHIGNSSMQLAIELDLDSTAIQQIQYKHKTKLLEQTKEILQIWSKKKQPTPTLLLLIKALHRIGKMGSLRGVRF